MKHNRRSIRLPGYDYAQAGAYFLTICASQRESIFGLVENGEMRLNASGEMVLLTWNDLPNHIAGIELGPFTVMPNHIHGIVWILPGDTGNPPGAGLDETNLPGALAGAGLKPAPTKRAALPEIVRQLKTFSARRINGARRTPGSPIWQRNYYEHIIRSEEELERICAYIADNPRRWQEDTQNPARNNHPRP